MEVNADLVYVTISYSADFLEEKGGGCPGGVSTQLRLEMDISMFCAYLLGIRNCPRKTCAKLMSQVGLSFELPDSQILSCWLGRRCWDQASKASHADS